MSRIYCDTIYRPKTKEGIDFCLDVVELCGTARGCFSENEDEFKTWVTGFYNRIREKLNLPNKIFAISADENRTEAAIVLFPKEPDGDYYKVYYDEETGLAYIESL